jgi:hypothetical protein
MPPVLNQYYIDQNKILTNELEKQGNITFGEVVEQPKDLERKE